MSLFCVSEQHSAKIGCTSASYARNRSMKGEDSALKSSQTVEDRQRIPAEQQVLVEAGDGDCGSGRAPHQTEVETEVHQGRLPGGGDAGIDTKKHQELG